MVLKAFAYLRVKFYYEGIDFTNDWVIDCKVKDDDGIKTSLVKDVGVV